MAFAGWALGPQGDRIGPEQGWRADVRGDNPLHNKIDFLMPKYSVMADDSSTEARRREASVLFCAAEGHLGEEEIGEALSSAISALPIFRELGDSSAVHDTLRVIINAQRLEANLNFEDRPAEAERLANQELRSFEEAGDSRGKAAMLLSLAECLCDYRSARKSVLQEAFEKAQMAMSLFTAAGDKKMQGIALLELAHIHAMRRESEGVLEKSSQAEEVFRGLDDKLGVARSLHGRAIASILDRRFADATSRMKEAATIFRECGVKKQEAFELCVIAEVHLEEEKAHKALPAAREALSIFRSICYSRGWEAASLFTVVRAYSAKEQTDLAVKAATDGLDKLRMQTDQRQEVYGYQILADALVASGKTTEALSACSSARELAKELGDKRLEVATLHTTMWAHIQRMEWDLAMDQMDDALALSQDLQDEYDEAVAEHNLAFLHLQKREYRQVMDRAEVARNLFERAESARGEAGTLLIMATASCETGRADDALEKCRQALALHQLAKDLQGECMVCSMMVDVHIMKEDVDSALEAVERCVECKRLCSSKQGEARALIVLARLLFDNDRHEEAQQKAILAKAAATESEDRLEMTQAQMLLTQIHLKLAEGKDAPPSGPHPLEHAMRSATEAVTLSGRCNDRGLVAISRFVRGRLLYGTGRLPEARRSAEDALRWFRKGQDALGEVKTLLLQGDVALDQDQKDEARTIAEQAQHLAADLGSAETDAEIAALFERIEKKDKAPVVQTVAMVAADDSKAAEAGPAVESIAVPEKKGLDPTFVRKKILDITLALVSVGEDEVFFDSPFMDAGMDSLSSVQLMSDLAKEFQMAMSPSLVFDYPTVASLSEHLVEESMSS